MERERERKEMIGRYSGPYDGRVLWRKNDKFIVVELPTPYNFKSNL
jgi:hypothetical protein